MRSSRWRHNHCPRVAAFWKVGRPFCFGRHLRNGSRRTGSSSLTTFVYNAAGNLVSKRGVGETTTYQYHAVGNLLGVADWYGDYLVDARQCHVGKKVDGTLVKGFLYSDALRPAAEHDGSGALVSRFVYADNNAPIGMTKGAPRRSV